MRISPNNGIPLSSVSAANSVNGVNSINSLKNNRVQAGKPEPKLEQNFDTVTIGSGGSFRQTLLSQISQEVRTATTTGTVNALREQVQAGTYKVDAGAIARKMLLLGEV